MKMRKLLATGVAATLAVTSLATVASAAEKTWDMGTSNAQINSTVSIKGDINPALGQSADQAVMQKVTVSFGGKIEAYKDKNGLYAIKTYHVGSTTVDEVYKQDSNKYDTASEQLVATIDNINSEWYSAPTLKVTGFKVDEKGNKAAVSKSYTMNADWVSTTSANNAWSIFVLKDTEAVYRDGEFAPQYFDIIETVELTGSNIVTGKIKDQEMYNALTACKGAYKLSIGDVSIYEGNTLVKTYEKNYADNCTKLEGETANKAADILAFALTNGGYKVSAGAWLDGSSTNDVTLSTVYPFIAEKYTTVDGARVIKRTDVQLLSDTDAHASEGATANDGNQSYVGEDTTQGTDPRDFAGFASQFAEFFNKQTNGTVTFKFTTPASASTGNNWVVGGIPSTETGIKNALNGASANDFGFFVNYRTTGSLQAVTSIDAAAGTVSFDVSDILDAMGGQTIGVVNDIWFGLAKGIEYDADHKGLYVESITFAYDEDGDVDADIEEEDDDVEAEDDVDVEEDDDVEIEDDATEDDDVAIEDDTTEDDDAEGDAEGDVIVETEDDDANPGTGVALAVVPALVAAAAVVVSKKRS